MPPPGIAHPVSHAQLGTLWSYNTVIPRDHGTTHTLHDSAFVQTPTYLQPVSAEEKPVVAVIGVGYVGLHLLQCFGPKYRVIAFDTSEPRIASLRQVFASYPDVIGTTKSEHLNESTHFLICVPTAVMSDKTIDISALQAAIDTLHRHARPGATVVIESSVFVGATRQLLTPLARLRGILAGMSPERVDPGRADPPAASIPKVVAGLDDIAPGSLAAIQKLYATAFNHVLPVSQPEVAEMMKLYENCQRMICIAYSNELADACRQHGIDPYEVCTAAATKPFGFMPMIPGLGVGGPCIPVNPFYLLSNAEWPLLRFATEKMRTRPATIAQRLAISMKSQRLSPKVLVVGVGFKRGQSIVAHSPSVDFIIALQESGGIQVTFVDPLVGQEVLPAVKKLDETRHWNKEYIESNFGLVVVAVKQPGLDYEVLQNIEVEIEHFAP